MSELARIYADERGEEPLTPTLAARLEDHVDGARRAWRDVDVDGGELVRALARVPRALSDVSESDVAELALALACGRGEARALAHLERTYFPAIDDALRAMRLDDDARAEVAQEVRRKLLVAEEGVVPLVGYAGRGTLRGLLKVTATRTALSMLRKGQRERPAIEADLELAQDAEPELDFLKAQYRVAFKQAFADAIATLEPHERNLLRLHFMRRVTLEALATMYDVHRATIVRQLAKARAQIERETAKALRARVDVERSDLEGVIDLVRSHFEVSAERLLRTEEPSR